ncbi:DNA methyltransferase [Pseudomonas protegens]|uniref:DNA methyltransferase n=1 Tax=Pseudomonas protegens TaxID=380021 RepID=UPI00069E24D9|nr:DNA methyltransferase [Pseudomonas protegens]
MSVAFEQWTNGREVPTLGTNAGAERLPFQTWRHFKEAFAPELVSRAIRECSIPVSRCIDPFGGSGTTALACQFLGVEPVTIEVNPYLADLIEAKLGSYDATALKRDLGQIIRTVRGTGVAHDLSWLPPTFVEPGVKDRWLFSEAVAQRVESYRLAIEELVSPLHRMLFKALLGGLLVDISNVYISGKGRRYRGNWQIRRHTQEDVDQRFLDQVQQAVYEIVRYSQRPQQGYTLMRGDCREAIGRSAACDVAIFSPPYPNSFDYTDVYNIELWALGYLSNADSNRALRQSTLASHVQVRRNFEPRPTGSPSLNSVSGMLHESREKLWSPHIPNMVDGYFADMHGVMSALQRCLVTGGEMWAVVGDSLYANIYIPVAKILAELAPTCGFEVVRTEAFRSMRASPQQGGRAELIESLLVFRKID